MENRRFVLIALLGVVIFFLYQAWQDEQAGQRAAAQADAPAAPVVEAPQEADVPRALDAAGSLDAVQPAGDAATSAGAEGEGAAGVIVVETDVYRAEISLAGGDLRRVELLDYPLDKNASTQPVALLNDRGGYHFVLQSGLAGPQQPLATHLDRYSAERTRYSLGDAEELEVPLRLVADGYVVDKIYRFTRGSYVVELDHRLENRRAEPLVASAYARLQRAPKAVGEEPKFARTFLGVGVYAQDDAKYKFQKEDFDDLEDEAISLRQTGGWTAMLQHYFVAAIIPAQDQEVAISAKPISGGRYQTQVVGPGIEVAPQASETFQDRVYIGPKLQTGLGDGAEQGLFGRLFALDGLEHVAPGLELTVDYGILTPIAAPLFWLLDQLHSLVRNWGFAIILLTILVKAAFFKLSEAQYRSMAKMRKFAPRIQEIKERYEGDRERQSKAMMELYKKERFNPLAGCWPLLVQMPVFFALYWVLQESVELRQADFALWINDLSAPDPFFVLPALFALSMWYQQRLSGQTMTMDPMQQRIMNVMPIAMGGFFAFFPAGLVLYWVVSNAFGIAQQWFITRRLDREGLGRKATA